MITFRTYMFKKLLLHDTVFNAVWQKGVYIQFLVSNVLKIYHKDASVRNKVDRSVGFLGLLWQIATWLRTAEIPFRTSGGQKSELQVLAGPRSPRPVGRFSFLPPPESGGSVVVVVSLQSLSPYLHGRLLLLCLLSLVSDTCHWFRAHPDNLGWFHLKVFNYICKDPIFQISSYAQVLWITTWTCLLGGHHSAHYICL